METNEILINTNILWKKMHLENLSAKYQPFLSCINVLNIAMEHNTIESPQT